MAQLLEKLAGDADGLVDGLHHVHGDADGAGLVRDGAGDGLADPPGGVGGELVALGVVKLLHRLNEAQVALLNQVQQHHAPAHIAPGDGHHQTEVGLGHAALGLLISGGDPHRQLHLLLRGQQRHLADLLQVHPHRVVGEEVVGQGLGLAELLLGDLLDLGQVLRLRQHIVDGGQQVGPGDVNVHAVGLQRLVELGLHLAVQVQLLNAFQLLGGELARLLALFQQLVEPLLRGLGVGRLGLLLFACLALGLGLLVPGVVFLQKRIRHLFQLFFSVNMFFCHCPISHILILNYV